MQAVANRLPSLRRAAAASGDGYAVRPRELDRANNVVTRFRNDDAKWVDLVDTRVGGIERARDRIEPDFAGDLLLELLAQRLARDHVQLPQRAALYLMRATP